MIVGTLDISCVHVGIWYDGSASPHAMRNIYCIVQQNTATSAHWMVSDPNFRLEKALLPTITASLISLPNQLLLDKLRVNAARIWYI